MLRQAAHLLRARSPLGSTAAHDCVQLCEAWTAGLDFRPGCVITVRCGAWRGTVVPFQIGVTFVKCLSVVPFLATTGRTDLLALCSHTLSTAFRQSAWDTSLHLGATGSPS